MGTFEEALNDVIDDDIEDLFGSSSKTIAKMVQQGTKSAIDSGEVTLKALDKNLDSIDVAKMTNGGTVTAISAATTTTTSAEIDCRGFKNVRIECEVIAISSATWTPSITGSEISGGTFGNIYRDVAGTLTAYTIPAQSVTGKVIYIIKDVPNFIKILETLAGSSGTITVKVTPFN
jgi:hypothetical protein